MLSKRIIACLDVRDGSVVKGVNFEGLRRAGDPAELAARYNVEGIDEVVILDVTATIEQRRALADTIRAVSSALFIPLAVGGGIRTEADADAVIEAGADKVSLNSAALAEPALLTRLAGRYGSQAVVVAIDAKREGDRYPVFSRSGSTAAGRDAVEWAREAEACGAGEILLTSIDRDGTRTGFDCEMTAAVSSAVSIPVIASGGAGTFDHFLEVFTAGAADAALAASIFHYSEHAVSDLKRFLQRRRRAGQAGGVDHAHSFDRSAGRPHRPARAGRKAGHRDRRHRRLDRPAARPAEGAADRSRRGEGRRPQRGARRTICGELPCRVGGGIRTPARAQAVIALGATKVIVSSALFTEHGVDLAMAEAMSQAVGLDRLIAAVDSRDGVVVIHGWRTRLTLTAAAAVRLLEPFVGEFLYTHVDREGLMQGTDMAAIEAVRSASSRALTAAGGITTQEESTSSIGAASTPSSAWRSTPGGCRCRRGVGLGAAGGDLGWLSGVRARCVGHGAPLPYTDGRPGSLGAPPNPEPRAPSAEADPKPTLIPTPIPDPSLRYPASMPWRNLFAALALLAAFLPSSCSRAPGLFSEQNARAHVSMLAGTIGSRAIGTVANQRARDYVVDQLKLFGFEVRVQEADARRPELGRTARVANVIATLPGARREAIGLVAHYDSRADAPGATDDGLGVAVALEAARVFAAQPDRQWSLFVLLTDGEEAGLMGAAALMTDRDVTGRLSAYVQVESVGSSGPALLFETGPGMRGWCRRGHAGRRIRVALVRAGDLQTAAERHRLLRDQPAGHSRPQLRTGRRQLRLPYRARHARAAVGADHPGYGENVVAILHALDATDITQRSPDRGSYFDVGGTVGVVYGTMTGRILSIAALVLGVVAWVRVTAAAVRIAGLLRWMLTFAWAAAGAVAVFAAMTGTTWALRASRQVFHPWYAQPARLFVLLVVVGHWRDGPSPGPGAGCRRGPMACVIR